MPERMCDDCHLVEPEHRIVHTEGLILTCLSCLMHRFVEEELPELYCIMAYTPK